MHIIIDEREHDLFEKIDTIVNFSGNNTSIHISREVLPLGDVLIQSDGQRNIVLIERKSFSDLLASIKDGRYEEQSYRLIHTCEYSPHNIIYMIEGMFSQLRSPLEKKIVLSAITSLNHFKGFSVLRTCSLNETAENIVWMAEKMEKEYQRGKRPAYILTNRTLENTVSSEQKETSHENNELNGIIVEHVGGEPIIENSQMTSANYCTVVKKVKKDNITPENIGEIVLCQIPGISSITAIAIMKHYGTFSNLIDELRNNPHSLENIVCQNGEKTRKISKTCVKNILQYLAPK